MTNKKPKFLIGIDEAGRGPLAGPVAVGAFCVPVSFDFSVLAGVRDSKKLFPQKREFYFAKIIKLTNSYLSSPRRRGSRLESKKVDFAVSFSSAKEIDKIGINKAIKKAMEKCLKKLGKNPTDCRVLLDGGLRAPEKYKNQQTIIKGDDKEKVISCASVTAKVLRDRKMCQLAKKYPKYCFEIHKGYGTAKHYEKLKKYGLCKEHRRCFLKNFLSLRATRSNLQIRTGLLRQKLPRKDVEKGILQKN